MPGAGRNKVDYTDERLTSQTFFADADTIVYDGTQINGASPATLNKAVTYDEDGDDIIALCSDGDAVVGKLLRVESDGACTVAIAGYNTLPAGAAATVTRGRKQVGALGGVSTTDKGYIRDVASATAAEQARHGPYAVANADLANVVIDFG